MKNPDEVIDSPDRPNVKLFSVKFKVNDDLTDIFAWLIDMLHQKEVPRTLVFTKTIADAAKLYNMCLLDGTVNMSLIQMFHSMTPDAVKDIIREDMSDSNGKVSVLFATNAAGLGVNYKNIKFVINFGPPQDMDTFLQHIGRAGRTGDQAQHLLVFTGRQLRNLTPDMLQYVRNNENCRREIQLKHYKATPQLDRIRHLCCDICDQKCYCDIEGCQHVLVHPAIQFIRDEEFCEGEVTEEEKDEVKIALELYAENLSAGQQLLPGDLFGVSQSVIEDIIGHLEFIGSPDDLLTQCCVANFSQAMDIHRIICSLLDSIHVSDDIDDDYTAADD